MKTKSFLVICSLTAIATFYSCKKSADNPSLPIVEATEKVRVGLQLNGDITISQTPMTGGRLQGLSNYVSAKTLDDSTIYAVDIRTPTGIPYAAGLFNRPYGIVFDLLRNTRYQINVAAIKKGTSFGLWWEMGPDGYQYFNMPHLMLFNMPLKNGMVYDGLGITFLDSLQYISVRGDTNINIKERYKYSELDTYYASTAYTAGEVDTILSLSFKRIIFGIKFNMINLAEGFLIADYDGAIKTEIISLSDVSDNLSIYTADTFRWQDSLFNMEKIHLTLRWYKNQSTVLTLGDKYLSPKRNSLTTVNVTFPSIQTTPTGIDIVLTDTEFTSENQIDF
jgi:hypothetical protein